MVLINCRLHPFLSYVMWLSPMPVAAQAQARMHTQDPPTIARRTIKIRPHAIQKKKDAVRRNVHAAHTSCLPPVATRLVRCMTHLKPPSLY